MLYILSYSLFLRMEVGSRKEIFMGKKGYSYVYSPTILSTLLISIYNTRVYLGTYYHLISISIINLPLIGTFT